MQRPTLFPDICERANGAAELTGGDNSYLICNGGNPFPEAPKTPVSVPEPSALPLIALSTMALIALRRKLK